jgi:hypothetical protein
VLELPKDQDGVVELSRVKIVESKITPEHNKLSYHRRPKQMLNNITSQVIRRRMVATMNSPLMLFLDT